MSPPPLQALRDLLRAYEAKHGKTVSGNTELARAVFQAREVIEGLDDTPEQAAALRRAVAALPDLLAALQNAANVLAALATGHLSKVERDSPALLSARAALKKAGCNLNKRWHQ